MVSAVVLSEVVGIAVVVRVVDSEVQLLMLLVVCCCRCG